MKKEEKINDDIYYGTKSEWVKEILDEPITYNDGKYIFKLDVIAEDDKGYYMTTKSYAKGILLDPYRMYKRPIVPKTYMDKYKSSE